MWDDVECLMIWHSVLIDNLCWSVEVYFWRLPTRSRWCNFKLIRPYSTLGIDSHCGLRRHFFIVDLIGKSVFNWLLGNGWSNLNGYLHSPFWSILAKMCFGFCNGSFFFLWWETLETCRDWSAPPGAHLTKNSPWLTPIDPFFSILQPRGAKEEKK